MRIAVPDEVVDRLARTRDPAQAAAFARSAPQAATEMLNLWDLEPMRLLEGATSSLVVLAAEHRDDTHPSHVVKVPFVRRRMESVLLARIGPPLVPRILGWSEDAIVMRYVEGAQRPVTVDDLAAAVTAWQRLELRAVPGLTPLGELMEDRLRRFRDRGGDVRAARRAQATTMDLVSDAPRAVLHGDLHDRHVIPRPTGPVLTDPIGVLGDPACEAALAAVLHRRGEGLQEARAAFRRIGADPDRLDAWIGVLCVLEQGAGTAEDALLEQYAA